MSRGFLVQAPSPIAAAMAPVGHVLPRTAAGRRALPQFTAGRRQACAPRCSLCPTSAPRTLTACKSGARSTACRRRALGARIVGGAGPRIFFNSAVRLRALHARPGPLRPQNRRPGTGAILRHSPPFGTGAAPRSRSPIPWTRMFRAFP